MGKNKTKKFLAKEKSQVAKEKSYVARMSNISAPARNLGKKELGAVIFGCKCHTIAECLQKKIFGLPAAHYSYIRNIRPGLALFLFNYSDRTLHGIYEAFSHGQMNIDAYAWTSTEGSNSTPYAAQVRVNVRSQCRPLREEDFKPVIADNYYAENHFWFELDKEQTGRLSALFLSSPMPLNPRSAVSQARTFDAPRPGMDEAHEHSHATVVVHNYEAHEHSYASVVVNNSSDAHAPQKKWAELFKVPSSASELEKGKEVSDLELELTSYSHAVSHNLPEACIEAHDSSIRQSWDELADMDSDARDLNEDEAEYEQDIDPAFESVVARESAVAVLSGESESSHEHNGFESVLIKLMHEIKGIKMYQFEQSMKITSLENELVESKLEIDLLKKQCKQLESTLSHGGDHSDEGDSESPNFTPGEYLFLVGGFNGFSWIQDLNVYSPSEDKVQSLCSMNFARSSATLSNLKDELYLFGGVHEGVWYDTVQSYNPMNNQWIQRPSLNQKKGSVAGATMHEKIYAIGGGNGVECFSEVEFFDLNVGRWISTRSMLEKRFAAAAVQINDALYVAGGYDGRDYLRSVERFDPRERSWSSLRSMNSRRGGHSMVACNGKLYALGGYDGAKMVPSAEVYDPRLEFWVTLEPMSVSRGYFGSFVSDGKIHVIGGLDEKDEVLDVVEWYEEGSGWQRSAKPSALGKRCLFSSFFWEN